MLASQEGNALSFSVLFDVPSDLIRSGAARPDWLGRCIGQLAALVILAAASPLMAICAWLIRRDGGPATFEHYRVGCGGRLFRCRKFRTMRQDAERALLEVLASDPALLAEWQRDQKLSNDPRVTSIGKWLRRTSLDE